MSNLRIGLAQINPTVGDYPANTSQICHTLEEAERRRLDWVVFSELILSGYPVWDLANKQSFVKKGLDHLREIIAFTRKKRVTAFLGFIDQRPAANGKAYNALAVIHNGKLIHKQYKTLLPTYDVFLEEIFFEPAADQKVFSLNGLRVGTSICEDLWDHQYPVKPFRILAKKGAKLIINISASPYHRHAAEIRDRLVRAKARENHTYIIYVNQVGGQDDLIFDGRSLIADNRGNIIFRAEPFKEGLFEFTLDLKAKNRPLPAVEEINIPKETYQGLVLGIKDYVRKNGFKRVVVGLSGGIDSALTATLAVDALGREGVMGVGMPGEFSSPSSLEDAQELAKNLGIEFRTRPITEKYRLFLENLKRFKSAERRPFEEGSRVTLAMENLQARLRGLELMYISNDEGCLLLSTGNKSELATGYCTLYGDMAGGLSVLGDVYKTDVYHLARYRNGISPVIPQSILDKVPTAELRPNQKDQDTLPPYEVLDEILLLYIEKNKGRDEMTRLLAKKGISPEVTRDVIQRVDQNEYKRRQTPPILRVTEKAWFGRRMPITNRFRG